VIFTLYLSLRKGLTHRLRLLGIEKHAKRLSAPWECRSKLTAGRPENVKCFGRFGTNAALCQIEGPRFRQRPCAVPFFGKRDVPFDRRRRSRLAGRRQGRPHIRHDRPAALAERERTLAVQAWQKPIVSHRLGTFIHTAVVISSLTEGRQTASEIHPLTMRLKFGGLMFDHASKVATATSSPS
jgi:hypothetical protein